MHLPDTMKSFATHSVGYFAHDDTWFVQVMSRTDNEVELKWAKREKGKITRAAALRAISKHGVLSKTKLLLDGEHELAWIDGAWKGVWNVCLL
jgi:hypothetical protein